MNHCRIYVEYQGNYAYIDDAYTLKGAKDLKKKYQSSYGPDWNIYISS